MGKDDCYYVGKSLVRSSGVLHSIQAHFRSLSSTDILFAKESSLELVMIGEDGILLSVVDQPVFGVIKDLAILPWHPKFYKRNPLFANRDLLAAISDSGRLTILCFSNQKHRFMPVVDIKLSSYGNSRHEFGRLLVIDSNASFIAVSALESRLIIFSVMVSDEWRIFDKMIEYPHVSGVNKDNIIRGTIWSMCFISQDLNLPPSTSHNPLLAIILNRSNSVLNELLLVQWNMKENVIQLASQFTDVGPLAQYIVEVPHSYGFAFLFRVGDALLLDLRDASNPCCVYRTTLNFLPTSVEEPSFVEESYTLNDGDDEGIFNVAARALLELGDMRVDNIQRDDPMSIDSDIGNLQSTSAYVCSWCWEPSNEKNPKMIFCVDSGEYFMIEISVDSSGVPKVDLSDSLYKGLPSKALLWVESGFLVALVEMADGMVLKLQNERLEYVSPIQNISPILDMSLFDCHDGKHDQIFACCGVAPDSSLRIIRSGINVEKLLMTNPIYQGITGTFSLRMKVVDSYHSFLVISFVEETRVLSVGLSFNDVTDSVGFLPDVCTLTCGTLEDGMLVQIHHGAVRLCLPTTIAHLDGISCPSPICMSWVPDKLTISLGAVGHSLIVLATSNPCFLFVLGVRSLTPFQYELYEMQHVRLQNELSCISIPHEHFQQKKYTSFFNLSDSNHATILPFGVDIGNTFVIGTHKPSVEIISFRPDRGLRVIAVSIISTKNTMRTSASGCIPQDVRLVLVDRLYVLSGLRNGLLLRFEWPDASETCSTAVSKQSSFYGSCLVNSSNSQSNFPVFLQLIATRRIGITPVFLIPLSDSLDADIIVLSDRPWLLQTARHGLAYAPISFQSSTHATPVSSLECPMGILFVAENSLHLVEMAHSQRFNVQKFCMSGTLRKVLYHSESKLLIVMRTDLSNDSYSSDICCVEPDSGLVLCTFKLECGEMGKSMELVRVGNELVILVGTSLTSGPAIMPSGEAESTMGRLIVLCLEHLQNSDSGSMAFCLKAGSSSQRISPFREFAGYASEQLSCSSLSSTPDDASCDGIKFDKIESWQLRLACSSACPGMVLVICPYLNRYFLIASGNSFFVCGFSNDNPQRVKKFAVGKTRFMITSLTSEFARIAVGDCRDGVLFYSYQEDSRKLEQLYGDPAQRLVAHCLLMDVDTAVVSDRKGNISILSCSNNLEDNASPETNLTVNCSYHMGEVALKIMKGSVWYKIPGDDAINCWDSEDTSVESLKRRIIATSVLGSVMTFIPVSRDEYEVLEGLESILGSHRLTAPILGNNHCEYRSCGYLGVKKKILDGDMLWQYLELTNEEQEGVLLRHQLSVTHVLQLLERLHYGLT